MRPTVWIVLPALILFACGHPEGRHPLEAVSPTAAVEASPTPPAPSVTGSPSSVVPAAGSRLVLYVSNQSFADDPVRVSVRIDGGIVVDDSFRVEGQHTWVKYEVMLSPGEHEITFASETGVNDTATILMPERGTRWAAVAYWYYPSDSSTPGAGQTPRSFTFQVSDAPLGFA